MPQPPASVDTPSAAYHQMSRKWALVDDLLGGTQTMRDAGKIWLPKEKREEESDYQVRLSRSYLYGAFKDTVLKLSAKPFSRAVNVYGEIPEALAQITGNADLLGRDLSQFSRTLFEDGLKYGLSHVLVDFPAIGGGLTLAEERATGARPYFCHISPRDMIAWRTAKQADGTEVLAQIRFKERRIAYDEAFGEREANYVRVIEPQRWELWEDVEGKGEYMMIDHGDHSFDGVPLVTFYANRKGFMESDPPLEDLAWMNLAHWQSLSDQRNILRFARIGILFASGVSEEEVEGGFSVGPSNMFVSTNPDAQLRYVEHTGRAIGAGEDDLVRLEERMEVLGLQPLIRNQGNVTATARSMDEARTHSNLQAWIRSLEATLEAAFIVAGRWVGVGVPDDFGVDVFNEFSISMTAAEDVRSLIDMRNAGQITHKTFLHEVKRRGVLASEVDIEQELAEAEPPEVIVDNPIVEE